jgi:hypothetical protein
MGGLVLAWLAGESIVVYRWWKVKAPPPPGALALSSGLFLGLAVIAQYQPARTVATVTAWALDLAILLQVIGKEPSVTTGWPPPLVDDPTVILPPGVPSKAPAQKGTTAAGGGQAAAAPAKKSPAGNIIKNIWDSLT